MNVDSLKRLLDGVEARPPSPADPQIDGLSPALVLEPGDEEAFARALELCHRERMAVIPVGGGSRIEVGNPPSRLDVYLSTLALAGIEDHIPGDLTVSVRAGTRISTLQDELRKEGQFLPVDPPVPEEATVGGVFALGEPGFRRRPGARPRDLLLGLEALLADGTRIKAGGRVVKNVAGYELMKLFVGSSGTLAVLTRAFLRLRALPEQSASLAMSFPRVPDAARAFREISSAPLPPEAAVLLNPEHSRSLGLRDWTLLLRYEGFREEVVPAIDEARKRVPSPSGPPGPPGPPREDVPLSVWDGLRDFPVLPGSARELLLRGQTAPDATFSLAERWQDGGPLVAYLFSGLTYSRTEDPEALPERREAARLAGGNVVLERAPSELKQEIDVFGEIPAGFDLMKRIKEKMDPDGILSPGRFVGRL